MQMSQILQRHNCIFRGELGSFHLQPLDNNLSKAMETIQYPREVLPEDEIMMFYTGLRFALRIERIKQPRG